METKPFVVLGLLLTLIQKKEKKSLAAAMAPPSLTPRKQEGRLVVVVLPLIEGIQRKWFEVAALIWTPEKKNKKRKKRTTMAVVAAAAAAAVKLLTLKDPKTRLAIPCPDLTAPEDYWVWPPGVFVALTIEEVGEVTLIPHETQSLGLVLRFGMESIGLILRLVKRLLLLEMGRTIGPVSYPGKKVVRPPLKKKSVKRKYARLMSLNEENRVCFFQNFGGKRRVVLVL